MPTRRAVLAAAAAGVLAAAGCGGRRDGAARHLTESARLDTAISEAVAEAGVPGALIGVWSENGGADAGAGAGEYVRAFGVADTDTRSPMETGFYSRIGSVTKTFTATAVLVLVDDGEVGLDNPVGDYLTPGNSTIPLPDPAITVRQLLTMRSGLPDYQHNPDFEKAVIADPVRQFTPPELLGWAFATPPAFPPGQRYAYSNTNYILLGLLVEQVTGRRLADYLTEQILRPLGLSHTSFPSGTEFPDPHPRGYTEAVEAGGPPVDATGWTASYTWAAGGMISRLADLRVWLPALSAGDLLSPALRRQQLLSPPVPGLPAGVGYGMGVLMTNGWIGHNGSIPGYQTVALHHPGRGITLAVMLNTDITPAGGTQPSTAVAKAITEVLTPENVYDL